MVPILMYHQVSPSPCRAYAQYTVTAAAFARHMKVLRTLGYRTVTPDDLAEAFARGTPLPPRRVLITFDDGFSDALRHAVPVLTHNGFTAVFFGVAALVGRTSEWTRRRGIEMPLADRAALREIARAGFVIGSHALTHRPLAELPDSECRYELLESRRVLEDVLGQTVRHLAYPFGSAGERERQAAADGGYQTACSINRGVSRPGDDLLMLPRVPVRGGDTIADVVCRLRTGLALREVAQRVRVSMKVSAFAR